MSSALTRCRFINALSFYYGKFSLKPSIKGPSSASAQIACYTPKERSCSPESPVLHTKPDLHSWEFSALRGPRLVSSWFQECVQRSMLREETASQSGSKREKGIVSDQNPGKTALVSCHSPTAKRNNEERCFSSGRATEQLGKINTLCPNHRAFNPSS